MIQIGCDASTVHDASCLPVDDCSRDGTRDLLRTQIEPLVDKILYHEVNQGKGAALRTGFARASGRVVVVQDADLEYDPSDIPDLVRPILSSNGSLKSLAFFSHVERDVGAEAQEAGFDLVVPRSRMARAGGDLVSQLVQSAG